MDNFKIIYKILKTLDKYKGNEDFDVYLISAEKLKVEYSAWEQLLIELKNNGYIDGIVITQEITDKFPHIAEPIQPRITLKGMEYLANNTFMKKAADALRLVGDIF